MAGRGVLEAARLGEIMIRAQAMKVEVRAVPSRRRQRGRIVPNWIEQCILVDAGRSHIKIQAHRVATMVIRGMGAGRHTRKRRR